MELHALRNLSPLVRGYAAELYVQYYLTRRGIVFTLHPFPTVGTDIVVHGLSGKTYSCEIKASTSHQVKINRTRPCSRGVEQRGYKTDEVDFFILVTLAEENVFIVPSTEVTRIGHEFCCSERGYGWQFKDRLDFFV